MRDIVSPLAGFSSPFGRGADPYAILGYKPPLVLDYENSKFRVSGSTSTAPNVYTATRTGLAAQLNSAGNLVWNAHNLITYSEDFSNAAWLKLAAGTGSIPVVTANQAIAPDGTLTADQVVFDCGAGTTSGDTSRLFLDIIDGFETEARVWIRTDSGSDTISLVNQAAQTNAVVTDEWQLFTVSNNQTSPNFQIRLNGDVASGNTLTVYIWGAHLYRSDLGGMAPVPLTRRVVGSTTYVPTTSAAVYLPREEAYTYVSGSLVGPYYQKESDARTNLFDYSNLFDGSGVWLAPFTSTISKDAVGPDGEANSATTLTSTGTFPQIYADVSVATSTKYTISIYAKAGTGNWLRIFLENFTTPAGLPSVWFDVENGIKGTVDAGIDVATIEDAGNGWYRCSITFTTDSVDTSGRISFRLVTGDGVATGISGQTLLFYGAQLEQGSTPTSYIPTAGSTVIRSADSTTISAANMPYPTPQVIGPELVTNGGFDTDISGWTALGVDGGTDTTFSWNASGYMEVTRGVGSVSGRPQQGFTTVVGEIYAISVDVVTAQRAFWVVGSSSGNNDLVSAITHVGNTTVTRTFVATSTTSYVSFWTDTSATTGIDNISVREINPLALSFQLEGLVTRADLEVSRFFAWELNANERILNSVDATNQYRFFQVNDGVFDEPTPSPTLTNGINVPFNISSRHGSTFVNGAADGTALTANTTPTALPDLSATTFELAPTFNGFIKEFRVWADDIGDSGISEAST